MRLCASGLPHPRGQESQVRGVEEDILSSHFVGLKTQKRSSGKAISFSLAIPGLYARDVFKAISRLSLSTRPSVKIQAALCAEIEYWRFLDN